MTWNIENTTFRSFRDKGDRPLYSSNLKHNKLEGTLLIVQVSSSFMFFKWPELLKNNERRVSEPSDNFLWDLSGLILLLFLRFFFGLIMFVFTRFNLSWPLFGFLQFFFFVLFSIQEIRMFL